MRHEETFQSARNRQRRGRVVDKQIDFLANRVVRAVVEQPNRASQGARSDQSSQIEPARAPNSSQPGHQGQPDRASRGQIEPARAPGAARSSQSSQPGRARSLGWSPSCPRASQIASASSNFVMDGCLPHITTCLNTCLLFQFFENLLTYLLNFRFLFAFPDEAVAFHSIR